MKCDAIIFCSAETSGEHAVLPYTFPRHATEIEAEENDKPTTMMGSRLPFGFQLGSWNETVDHGVVIDKSSFH